MSVDGRRAAGTERLGSSAEAGADLPAAVIRASRPPARARRSFETMNAPDSPTTAAADAAGAGSGAVPGVCAPAFGADDESALVVTGAAVWSDADAGGCVGATGVPATCDGGASTADGAGAAGAACATGAAGGDGEAAGGASAGAGAGAAAGAARAGGGIAGREGSSESGST
jgi:hypothetical protein